MGRIIIRDRPMKRSISTSALAGEIEIDLTSDDPTVTVPDGVSIERATSSSPSDR